MTNFNNILIQIFDDMFSYIGLNHKFMSDVPASSLSSSEEANILVGIAGDMGGNIIFGYTEQTAKEIAAKLIGVNKIKKIDKYSKAAIADFFSEFSKRFVNKIKAEMAFNIESRGQKYTLFSSNPIYVSGEDMYELISRMASKKIFFKVNGEKFGISYCLENN